MEQNCKRSDESLRHQDVVNEDIISKLPEDLLLKILSSLTTDTVVATSLLSKRWRHVWTLVPNLEFNSSGHNISPENVCKSLISHKAPVLETLRWNLGYFDVGSNVGKGIKIAFARHVRKLVLYVRSFLRFPSELCSCNNTLEMLILEGSIRLDFPSRVCFKSLRKLHLYEVTFTGEESFGNLLCGCPSLEDLVVARTNVQTFTIAVPSLQRLTIQGWHKRGGGGYVINAPCLKYLSIEGFHRCEFGVIENVPKLVQAKLIYMYDITNVKSLVSLTSAKRLSLVLSPLEVKFSTGCIFYQLVCLELCSRRKEWRNLLSLMLDSCPKLQVLKLMNRYSDFGYCGSLEWEKPKCVPDCLLFHLETFEWLGYKWKKEDQKEVATYILRNAQRLKKATFFLKNSSAKLEKRKERKLYELASVVRASNSCKLVFDESTIVDL